MTARPCIEVAVIMRHERIANRWQPWRWVLEDVVPQEAAFGREPRILHRSRTAVRWLHPGFTVELFHDDAEGYYLNLTTSAPCWFVLWRMDETQEDPIARPAMVSLSYHDAGRWLDAQEMVEQVPAPPPVIEWMRAFAQEHCVIEPRRRARPESFRPLRDRFGNPALVSTERNHGAGHE